MEEIEFHFESANTFTAFRNFNPALDVNTSIGMYIDIQYTKFAYYTNFFICNMHIQYAYAFLCSIYNMHIHSGDMQYAYTIYIYKLIFNICQSLSRWHRVVEDS